MNGPFRASLAVDVRRCNPKIRWSPPCFVRLDEAKFDLDSLCAGVQ